MRKGTALKALVELSSWTMQQLQGLEILQQSSQLLPSKALIAGFDKVTPVARVSKK